MPRIVEIPNVGVWEYPDDMSDDAIHNDIYGVVIPNADPANPDPEQVKAYPHLFPDIDRGSFFGGLGSGVERLGRAPEAAGAAIGRSQEELDDLKAQMEEDKEKQKYRASLDDVTGQWGRGDYLGAAGTLFGDVLPQTLGESIPDMGAIGAGAMAGAIATAPIPIPGARVAGAVIGGAIAGLPTFFGMNVERQIEENNITDPEEIETAKAAAAAALQGSLEGLIYPVLGFLPGVRGMASKGLSDLVKGGVKTLTRPDKLAMVSKAARAGGATEPITEMGQQALERLQAGLEVSPANQEALKEYIEAAVLGGLLGVGFGAVGGGAKTYTTSKDLAKTYDLIEQRDAEQAARKAGQDRDMAIYTGAIPDPDAPLLLGERPEIRLDPVDGDADTSGTRTVERRVNATEGEFTHRNEQRLIDEAMDPDQKGYTEAQRKTLHDVRIANEALRGELFTPEDLTANDETGEMRAPTIAQALTERKAGQGDYTVDQEAFTIEELETLAAEGEVTGADPEIVAEELQKLRKLRRPATEEHRSISEPEILELAARKNILTGTRSFDALVKYVTGAESLATASPFRRTRMKETLEAIPDGAFKGAPKDLINKRERNFSYKDFTQAVQLVLNNKTKAGKPVFSYTKLKEQMAHVKPDQLKEIRTEMERIGLIRKRKTSGYTVDNALIRDEFVPSDRPIPEPRPIAAMDNKHRFDVEERRTVDKNEDGTVKRDENGKPVTKQAYHVVARPKKADTGFEEVVSLHDSREEAEENARRYAKAPSKVTRRTRNPETGRDKNMQVPTTTADLRGMAADPKMYADTVRATVAAGPRQGPNLERIQAALDDINERRGLQELGVPIRLVNSVRDALGTKSATPEGAEGAYLNKLIYLGLDVAGYKIIPGSPVSTHEAQVIAYLSEVLSHEQIHALKEAGVISDSDYALLTRLAAKKNRPEKYRMAGKGATKWSYLDDVRAMQPKLPEEQLQEEAVAEMFRDWGRDPASVTGKPASLFRKIVKFITTLGGFFNKHEVRSVGDIFGEIDAGTLQGDGVAAPDGEAQFSVKTIDVRISEQGYSDFAEFEVLEDPSPNDILRHMKKIKDDNKATRRGKRENNVYPTLRYIYDVETDKIFVWNADTAIHEQVREELGLPYGVEGAYDPAYGIKNPILNNGWITEVGGELGVYSDAPVVGSNKYSEIVKSRVLRTITPQFSVGPRHADLTPPQQAIYEDGVKRFTAAFKKYGTGTGRAPEGRAAYALDRIEDGVEKRLRAADVSFVRDDNGNRFGFDVLDEIKGMARQVPQFSVAPPVDSAAFEKWFADSKVTDENGEPLPVYRGLRRGPPEGTRDVRQWRATESYSPFPDIANIYASNMYGDGSVTHGAGTNVRPAFLSIQNPLRWLEDRYSNRDPGIISLGTVFSDLKLDIWTTEGRGRIAQIIGDLVEIDQMGLTTFQVSGMSGINYVNNIEQVQDLWDDANFNVSKTQRESVGQIDKEEAIEELYYAIDNVEIDTFVLADTPSVVAAARRAGYDGIQHMDVLSAGAERTEGLFGKAPADVEGIIEHRGEFYNETWRPFDDGQAKSPFNEKFDRADPQFSVTNAAVRYKGQVYKAAPGEDHRAIDYPGQGDPTQADETQFGFIDSRGRFVDRWDAYIEAEAAGQLTDAGKNMAGILPMLASEYIQPQFSVAKDFRGEYWLDTYGTATFADGDIGDFNHEALVIMEAQTNVVSTLADNPAFDFISDGDMDGEFGPSEETMDAIGEKLDAMTEAEGTSLDVVLKRLGVDPEEFNIANDQGDARDYGLRVNKQIRVAGNEIQMYDLSSGRMRVLADGLYDAYGEDVENGTFNIEDSGRGKYYTEVPFSVLSEGKYAALRNYEHGVRFSVAPPVDSAAFKKWFKNSQITDTNGSPLIVYHGADTVGIQSFNTENGLYFTDDIDLARSFSEQNGIFDDEALHAGYLSIQNPLEITHGIDDSSPIGEGAASSYMTPEKIAAHRNNGYDGIVARLKNGKIYEIVAFDPDQFRNTPEPKFSINKPIMKRYAVKVRRVGKPSIIRYFFAENDLKARELAARSPAINRAGFDVGLPYVDDPAAKSDMDAPKFSIRRWRRVMDEYGYQEATEYVETPEHKREAGADPNIRGQVWLDGEQLPVVLFRGIDQRGAGFGFHHMKAKANRFGGVRQMSDKLGEMLAQSHQKDSPNHRVGRYVPKQLQHASPNDYQMTWKDPADGTIYVLGLEKHKKDGTDYAAITTFYPRDRTDRRDVARQASVDDITRFRAQRDAGMAAGARYSVAQPTGAWAELPDGITPDEKSESIAFSVTSWDDPTRQELIDWNMKHKVFTPQQLNDYIQAIDTLAAAVAKNPELLYEAKKQYNPLKPNSDPHYNLSLDFSTLCRKRLILHATIEAIQADLGYTLHYTEILDIRAQLKDKGYVVSCGVCYVDAKRMHMGTQIENLQNKTLAEIAVLSKSVDYENAIAGRTLPKTWFTSAKGREKLKTRNRDLYKAFTSAAPPITRSRNKAGDTPQDIRKRDLAKRKAFAETADQIKAMTTAEELQELAGVRSAQTVKAQLDVVPRELFLSQDGFDQMALEHPEAHKTFTLFLNAQSMKTPESRTEYAGQIKNKFTGVNGKVLQSTVDNMNANSGLRWQSWSDFELIHALDAMQAILDMALVGLQGHAYTKVAEMVEVLGNTGLMMNLSLIPKGTGLNAEGQLIFDDVEGIPYKTALDLRKRFDQTTGTIAVGASDAHIRAMMADPNIDYIIPYHASGLAKHLMERVVKDLSLWRDYANISGMAGRGTDAQVVAIIDVAKYRAAGGRVLANGELRLPHHMEIGNWWNPEITGDENAAVWLKLVREAGLRPEFPMFVNADYTQAEPGYWKMLVDRRAYDNNGVGIVQQVVKPEFNMDAVQKLLKGYTKEDRKAPKKIVEQFVKSIPAEREATKAALAAKFSVAADAPTLSFENQVLDSLSGKDKTIWYKAEKWRKKQLSPGGLLPQAAFMEKILRDGEFNVGDDIVFRTLKSFETAVKATYGKRYAQLTDTQKRDIDLALHGLPVPSLSDAMKGAVARMRQDIDALSEEYLKAQRQQVAELQAQGNEDGALRAQMLVDLIESKKGQYVTRSYKVFSDPNWHKKVDRQVMATALQFLTNQYQGDGNKAAHVLGTLLMGESTAYTGMEALIKESTLGARDLTVLMKRKKIAPEIRAVMGENTDADLNYTRTMMKMNRLIYNTAFLNKIREVGMGQFLFKDGTQPPDATVQMAGDKSAVLAPLAGLWVTPEVKQAFRDALGKSELPAWQGWLLGLNGAVKYGKIVLSPATQIRNFFSAPFFAIQAGAFNPTHLKLAATTVWDTVKARDGNFVNYYRNLVRIGLLHDMPNAGMLQDLMDDSANVWAALDHYTGAERLEPTKAKLKQYNDILKKVYRGSDDFWKIVAFETELANYMKAKNLTRAEAEPIVAKRIRDTIPTYSLTGTGMKKLGRFPIVGSFVAFSSEIIRTTKNNLKIIQADLKDPDLKAMAHKRILGMAIAHSWAAAGMAMTKSMFAIDDDEEEAVRKLGSPWAENAHLAFLGRDDQGRLRTVDMSFLDPYNIFHRPLVAMARNQPWEDSFVGAARELLDPFFGWDIAASALYEVLSNNKIRGGQVYNPDAPTSDQSAAIGEHLIFALGPGALGPIRKTYKAIKGEKDATGKVYDLNDEIRGAFGLRVSTYDPKFSLYFRVGDFREALSNANSYLYKVAADINPVDQDALTNAFETANDIRLRAYNDMQQFVNAAKKSGVSDNEIRHILQVSNVSKQYANSLARGREAPKWRIGTTFLKGATKRAKTLISRTQAQELRARKRFIREQARNLQ